MGTTVRYWLNAKNVVDAWLMFDTIITLDLASTPYKLLHSLTGIIECCLIEYKDACHHSYTCNGKNIGIACNHIWNYGDSSHDIDVWREVGRQNYNMLVSLRDDLMIPSPMDHETILSYLNGAMELELCFLELDLMSLSKHLSLFVIKAIQNERSLPFDFSICYAHTYFSRNFYNYGEYTMTYDGSLCTITFNHSDMYQFILPSGDHHAPMHYYSIMTGYMMQ